MLRTEVEQPRVEEAAGDDPVPLAVWRPAGPKAPVGDELSAAAERAALPPAGDLGDEDDDVERRSGRRSRTAPRRRPQRTALRAGALARRTRGTASRPASRSCSRGRSAARSSSTRRWSRGRGAGSRSAPWARNLLSGARRTLAGARLSAALEQRRQRRVACCPRRGSPVTRTASAPSRPPGDRGASPLPSASATERRDGRTVSPCCDPHLVDPSLGASAGMSLTTQRPRVAVRGRAPRLRRSPPGADWSGTVATAGRRRRRRRRAARSPRPRRRRSRPTAASAVAGRSSRAARRPRARAGGLARGGRLPARRSPVSSLAQLAAAARAARPTRAARRPPARASAARRGSARSPARWRLDARAASRGVERAERVGGEVVAPRPVVPCAHGDSLREALREVRRGSSRGRAASGPYRAERHRRASRRSPSG